MKLPLMVLLVLQVCVEPCTSALSITLPASELCSYCSIAGCQHCQAAVNRYLPPTHKRQQTNCVSLLLLTDRTDGRMDRQTPYHYIDAHQNHCLWSWRVNEKSYNARAVSGLTEDCRCCKSALSLPVTNLKLPACEQ